MPQNLVTAYAYHASLVVRLIFLEDRPNHLENTQNCEARSIGRHVLIVQLIPRAQTSVEGTWAFFNLIFVQNICVLLVNTYSLKIDKTGVKNDSNEAIIAPLVFTILSAVLIFGLSDKIYI